MPPFRAPGILRWLLEFWQICASLLLTRVQEASVPILGEI